MHNLETIVKLNLYYFESISLSGLDQTLLEALNTPYFLVNLIQDLKWDFNFVYKKS